MRHLWSIAVFLLLLLGAPPSEAVAQEWQATPTWTDDLATDQLVVPRDWVTEKGTFLRLHGHPSDRGTLLRLARHGSDALPRLADRLQVPIGHTVHVYLATSEAQFRELQPGRAPTWADAVAYPALGVVILRAPDVRGGTAQPLERVFDHELVHILLGRAFAPAVPPQWLQEGTAQLLAGEVGPQVARDIASGMATGGLIDLEDLGHGFPSDPLRARLAYAQSADLVAWLEEHHGEDVVPTMVREARAGRPMAAAVRTATGRFLHEIEADWSRPYTEGLDLSWTALANEGVLFGFGGIALAIGGVMRRRRFHQRMEELAREEALIDELAAQLSARRHAEG